MRAGWKVVSVSVSVSTSRSRVVAMLVTMVENGGLESSELKRRKTGLR
jgi:hypothetical protein